MPRWQPPPARWLAAVSVTTLAILVAPCGGPMPLPTSASPTPAIPSASQPSPAGVPSETAGRLDPAFGNQGRVQFRPTPRVRDSLWLDEFNDVAIQPSDQKIVAVGRREGRHRSSDWLVARFTPDGNLDESFGDGGLSTVGSAYRSDDSAAAVAIQPDGRIIVAGNTGRANRAGDFTAVARFTADGRLDPSFGAGGQAQVDLSPDLEDVSDVVLQADGKIVEIGSLNPNRNSADSQFAAIRWNADGSLDRSFGNGGVASVNVTMYPDSPTGVAIDPSGRIILAGYAYGDVALVRLMPDGTQDTGFAHRGSAHLRLGTGYSEVTDVVLQPDGKIVVGGSIFDADFHEGRFLVARFADGALDESFNGEGYLRIDFPATIALDNDASQGIAIQPDGGIVLAGTAREDTVVALTRVTPDGQLDPTFGAGGMIVTDIRRAPPIEDTHVAGMAIQADGNLVVVGETVFVDSRLAVLRFLGS